MSGTCTCRMSWNCWWTSRSSMMKTFFQQACPICGRTVRIEKSLRFSPVVCQHCGGDFPANDQSRVVHSNTILPVSQAEKIDALLWKSDQALRLGKVSHCWNHEATSYVGSAGESPCGHQADVIPLAAVRMLFLKLRINRRYPLQKMHSSAWHSVLVSPILNYWASSSEYLLLLIT